jgi:hypothetical protein
LDNLWDPIRIGHIKLAHRRKIRSGEPAAEFAGQPGSQLIEELLAILGTVSTLLFLLEDSAANFVVSADLQ